MSRDTSLDVKVKSKIRTQIRVYAKIFVLPGEFHIYLTKFAMYLLYG